MNALKRYRQNLRAPCLQEESTRRTRPSARQYNSATFITSVAGLSYSPKISVNDLAKVEPDFVGQGGSFRVEKTIVESSTSPPRVVVLKRPLFVEDEMDASKRWKAVLLEILALMHPPLANHENIVDLLAICWDSFSTDTSSKPEWPILVMPYATHGTLDSFQHSFDATLPIKFSLCLDVAHGLSILHSCSIVHGDLKSENVLIFAESRGPVARLCDFGCSLLETDEFDSLLAGSEPWNAPEWKDKLQRKTLSLTDVYSFGLLIWRVISSTTDPIKELSLLAGSGAVDLDSIEQLKRRVDDSFLVALKNSTGIGGIDSESQRESIKEILELTVRADPQERKLGEVAKKLDELVIPDSSRLFDNLDARPISKSDAGTPVEFPASLELQVLNKQSWLHQVQVFKTFQEKSHTRSQGPSNAELSESEFCLFFCYLLGIGVEPDAKLAFGSLYRSALAGQPDARALIHRASLVLKQPFPEDIESNTMINWLARGIELGFFQAREDFLDLIDSQRDDAIEEKKRLRKIYALAVSRLRNYTAGIGKGYFLDAVGEHLGSFSIDNEQQFQTDVKEKAEDKMFNINKFSVNERGDLALHFVAACGAGHAVRFLIQYFQNILDINAVNQEGETALLSASRAGQAETVCLLLSNGADLRCSQAGESPLHWLSAFDDEVIPKLVELLIEFHPVLRTEPGRATYLHQKAFSRKLFNMPYSTIPSGAPLHRAVWFKNLEVVKKLLDLGADPEEGDSDEEPRSALYFACKYHLFEPLRVMLKSKGTPDVNLIPGPSLLHAALSGRDDLQQLIDHGICSQIQAIKTIGLLMELKANPGLIAEERADHEVKRTALFEAVESGYLFGVELCLLPMLLASKDLVDARCGKLLLTPLQMAVQKGSLKIVQALLKAGADPKITSGKEFLTTLHYCASMDMTSPHGGAILDSVILYFEDVDQKPKGGATAFAQAVHLLHFDIASSLLDKGADIDAEFSSLGENALMSGESTTILGFVVQHSTLAALTQVRFLLGLDSQGKRRKDWRHPLPSGITSKDHGTTVFHIAALRRKLPIYAIGVIKEILGYLIELYPKELLDYQTKSESFSVENPRCTALHIAAFTTNIEALAALLRAGANKDIVDAYGMKPIENAVERMQEEMEDDEETGWTETIRRKERERQKQVFIMLGGNMDIFETAEVSELETTLELELEFDGSSESE